MKMNRRIGSVEEHSTAYLAASTPVNSPAIQPQPDSISCGPLESKFRWTNGEESPGIHEFLDTTVKFITLEAAKASETNVSRPCNFSDITAGGILIPTWARKLFISRPRRRHGIALEKTPKSG